MLRNQTYRQLQPVFSLVAYLDAAELAAGWTLGQNGEYSFDAGGQPTADAMLLYPGDIVATEGVGFLEFSGTLLVPAKKTPNSGSILPVTGGDDHKGKATIVTGGLPSVPANDAINTFLDAADKAANFDVLPDGSIAAKVANDPVNIDAVAIAQDALIGVSGKNAGVFKLKGRVLIPDSAPLQNQTFVCAIGATYAAFTAIYDVPTGFPDPTV